MSSSTVRPQIKQTIYTPKVIEPSIDPIPTVNIDDLSLEEIEKMLPQVQANLEASKKRPIDEAVNYAFNEEWPSIMSSMESEFNSNLGKDRKNFLLKAALNAILSRAIGEELTKEFFLTISHCQESQNFKGTQKFFQKVKGPECLEIREIAKVSFAIYRLNKKFILGDAYFGKPSSLKETIREAEKAGLPLIKRVISEFKECGLID